MHGRWVNVKSLASVSICSWQQGEVWICMHGPPTYYSFSWKGDDIKVKWRTEWVFSLLITLRPWLCWRAKSPLILRFSFLHSSLPLPEPWAERLREASLSIRNKEQLLRSNRCEITATPVLVASSADVSMFFFLLPVGSRSPWIWSAAVGQLWWCCYERCCHGYLGFHRHLPYRQYLQQCH